jgi:hypothetical protein
MAETLEYMAPQAFGKSIVGCLHCGSRRGRLCGGGPAAMRNARSTIVRAFAMCRRSRAEVLPVRVVHIALVVDVYRVILPDRTAHNSVRRIPR